ncbi:MAG: GNAT family N-acetyltransferase [Pyrinomonadaceae bacterium]|nr:GNAT family N-acetyltransferase [Pyrinomonadaceae bacterium]
MRIDFRQITNNDLEFLWKLHNLALKDYVAQTWDWDEDWQRLDFTEKFNPADGKIIVGGGVDAGFWRTIERETETLLVSIRILPEFQNRGIGTKIIKNLLNESKNPVRLQVLKVNPARRLYEKLGFEIFDETETHFKMIRRRD